MIVFGIAGGIGSGKSYVRSILESMGYPCFDSDIEAKLLYTEDINLVSIMKNRYGNDIYIYDNENKVISINKIKLSQIIFSNSNELKFINSEIHPRVRTKYKNWLKSQENNSKNIAFLESALIFDSGLRDLLDKTILVTSDIETRISRAMKRDNCNREQVLSRINKQKSDNEMKFLSDYIIYNDNDKLIIPQIIKILSDNKIQ